MLALALCGAACGRTPAFDVIEERCAPAPIRALSCDAEDPCAVASVAVEAAAPDVLMSLDRSCSMASRWDIAVNALREVLLNRGSEARWGLSVFPDHQFGECAQGDILVPIGDHNEDLLHDLLAASLHIDHEVHPTGPCITNLSAAVGQAATDPAFEEPHRQKVNILITDGWNTCDGRDGADGAIELVQSMHDERGIETYVISFGGGVGGETLAALAHAGGAPRDIDPPYYIAEANLAAVMDEIVGGLSCRHAIDIQRDDVELLEVTLDREQTVPADAIDGWTYDAANKTVVFHGTSCQHLQERGTTVDFALRCG